jgi:hypothetical protein
MFTKLVHQHAETGDEGLDPGGCYEISSGMF